MAENITREELLEELCNAVSDGIIPIQPGEFTTKEVARKAGIHISTLKRRVDDGDIPEGWEIVKRRGNNGQTTNCYRKISKDGV